MTWRLFTEIFTLLSLALWSCRTAYAIGWFIGEQTRKDSAFRMYVSAVLAFYRTERQVAELIRMARQFQTSQKNKPALRTP